jgi:hypothetical protein
LLLLLLLLLLALDDDGGDDGDDDGKEGMASSTVTEDVVLVAGDEGTELEDELTTGEEIAAAWFSLDTAILAGGIGILLTLPLPLPPPPPPIRADSPNRRRRTGKCSLSTENNMPRVILAGTTSVSSGTVHPGVKELSLPGSAMMRWNSIVDGGGDLFCFFLSFVGFNGSKKLGLGEGLLWWATSLVIKRSIVHGWQLTLTEGWDSLYTITRGVPVPEINE